MLLLVSAAALRRLRTCAGRGLRRDEFVPPRPVGESGVAVIADTWWHAKTALDAVTIQWDGRGNEKVSSATIDAMLKEGLTAEQAFVGNSNGDAKGAIAAAAKKVEAVYAYPLQNHAPMAPMNATARWTPEKCEVWVPTQNG